MHRGLGSHRGRLHRQGSVWGQDFVLSNPKLIESAGAFALTYIEVCSLQRKAFLDLLDKHRDACPELAQQVRRFICWLAFQRALLIEAYRRRESQGSCSSLGTETSSKSHRF